MRMGIRVLWLAAVFSLAAAGQTPSEPCRVEGSVVNAVTGQPVRKARLTLMPAKGGEPIGGATDAQGKYALANVAPGMYRLQVSHDGYVAQNYGAKKPGEDQKGDPLDLAPGSVKTKVDLHMTPLGAIMGHIHDENGDPVRQVEVGVMVYGHGPAGKALQMRNSSQTDATGEYRIFDLPPGKYYLRAKPPSAQMPTMVHVGESYTTTYYPNSTQPTGAAAVDLAAGQEQRGLDFVLHPISTASIRGRVIKPAGGENCSAGLEGLADSADPNDGIGFVSAVRDLVITTTSGSASEPANLEEMITGGRRVDKDGKFEFQNVPVGSHSLTANCNIGKQRYSTKMPIQLEAAGLENVELRPVGPSNMTGQVQVEGESKSNIAETRIFLEERDGETGLVTDGKDTPDGTVGEQGVFAFHNLPPATYHIHVEPPQGLYVKSVAWSGRDVLEPGVDMSGGGVSAELHVVLSANGGTIDGSVENGEGAKVTLIPSDPQRMKTLAKLAVAAEGGHFSFAALPPGRYKLFAWEDADVDRAMYDLEFRKPFEGKGETVDVAEKQKATVQLKAIPGAEK
ncbi:MAG TPA: carboxypeptidase-like regulatory domain-containing protein [Bryobacteraceae bacterium]|nr:carboxypeptidase-like regulatory domain-containing protein [Bryobacteraceae bacterium]